MGLKEDGIRTLGVWEPLAHEIRLGRGADRDLEKDYQWTNSEKFVRGLKDRGFNLLITQFEKGYGLKAEAKGRQDTKRLVQICRKHGMYIGGYFRYSTFIPETIKQEIPDCVERFADATIYGPPSRYNDQYWRFMPCPSSNEFLEYFDKFIAIGVEEIHLDAIFVDGVALRLEPFSCHCPRCHEGFRQWLQDRYPTPDEQFKRFGFTGFDYVELPDPRFSPVRVWVNPILHEPIAQEWLFFRCHLLEKIWKFIVDAVHRRDPDCFVLGNTSLYPHLNIGSYSAVELARIFRCGSEGLFSEEHQYSAAHLSDDDYLQGYFESAKKCRRHGISMFAYNCSGLLTGQPLDPEATRRSMAHQMAFTNDSTGVYAGQIADDGWPQPDTNYHFFHRDHRELFTSNKPAHDLAMYCSDRTRALNCGTPIVTDHLALDTLMRSHVPFGYLMAEDHADVFDYRAIILPEIECMTVEELETIVRYVKQGGGLVIISANTGRQNELGRLHQQTLSDRLGLEFKADTPAFTARLGKGRVAYVPMLVAPEGTPKELVAKAAKKTLPYFELEPPDWHGPRNADDLLNAVKWASQGFSFEVLVPRTTVVEFAVKNDSPRYLVHLVNFDLKSDVGPFEIITHGLGKVSKVQVFSPDEQTPKSKVCDADGPGQCCIQVGGFHRYIIVAINVAKSATKQGKKGSR